MNCVCMHERAWNRALSNHARPATVQADAHMGLVHMFSACMFAGPATVSGQTHNALGMHLHNDRMSILSCWVRHAS